MYLSKMQRRSLSLPTVASRCANKNTYGTVICICLGEDGKMKRTNEKKKVQRLIT